MNEMTTEEFALETWKTTIEAQEHFNTLEMQIRNIAITVLTATIGAAGLVFNQSQETIREAIKANQPIPPADSIQVVGFNLSAPDVIVVGGLIAWLAFYFMDRWWYHRLLRGAVNHAKSIEEGEIVKEPYRKLMSLSTEISAASPFRLGSIRIGSNRKIDLFYGTVMIVLILIIVFVF